MEPVKTCATCRHSVVGRRDPMDWWKRRLCAHPGLVDRVEGRPLYEAIEARGKDGACGCVGVLWEAQASALGPGKVLVYPDARQADPVDERAAEVYDPAKPYGEGVLGHGMPALFSGDVPEGEGPRLEIRPELLPRKPRKARGKK